MTSTKITLPNWVELNRLSEEEKTTARMAYILALVQFIEENNIFVDRLYFDRRGAYIYRHNHAHPWRYHERGLAQAKFELLRLKAESERHKEYLPHTSADVQAAIDAYVALGWGHGMSFGPRQVETKDEFVRIFQRGRWYSLERKHIQSMLRRAKKAQMIVNYFHRQFSLDAVPAQMRPLCVDVSKCVHVGEDTGKIRIDFRCVNTCALAISKPSLGTASETFPATPAGAQRAACFAEGYAAQWAREVRV